MKRIHLIVCNIAYDQKEAKEKGISLLDLPQHMDIFAFVPNNYSEEMLSEVLSEQIARDFGCKPVYFVRIKIPPM